MSIRFLFAVWVGKKTQLLLRLLGRQAGTWPGEIALRIDPEFIAYASTQVPHIILIAGTNGKTTTAKMIETILRRNGLSVFHNESGANLDNGLASAFLGRSDWIGKIHGEYGIFEVDEATLPHILKQITPTILVLLNLFRDQLDRYGEVDTIAEKWLEALTSFWQASPRSERERPESDRDAGQASMTHNTPTIIINADDPHLAYIGGKLKGNVKYFGLEDMGLYLPAMQHATDTIYCPNCGSRLTFGGVYFSHLGKWTCGNCGFTHPKMELTAKDVISPLEGVYNRYNTLSAALTAICLGLDLSCINEALIAFVPAFGRQESIESEGKHIKILLSKNPTGMNESIRTALGSAYKGPILFVLNDGIADGRDVSWIWDVDFEILNEQHEKIVYVSGDRYLDLGLRLKYAGVESRNIESLGEAIQVARESTKEHELLWILPTYSAMLEVRENLTGRKIL